MLRLFGDEQTGWRLATSLSRLLKQGSRSDPPDVKDIAMPQKTWSTKRERQDAHIKDMAPEGPWAKFEDSVLAVRRGARRAVDAQPAWWSLSAVDVASWGPRTPARVRYA